MNAVLKGELDGRILRNFEQKYPPRAKGFRRDANPKTIEQAV